MNNKTWDKLYQHVAREFNKKSLSWRSTGRIFPSSAGTNCELKLKYDFLGTDRKSNFIWYGCEYKIGNSIHEWIQNNFKEKFGKRVKIEKRMSYYVEGIWIHGKYDILLDDIYLIEIKTVKESEVAKNHKKNIRQVQWYMGVLKLNTAYISYFNRENGVHLRTFKIDFDQEVFNHTVNKFARIINNAKDLRSDTRECKYCYYSWKCPDYKKQW